MSDERPDEEAEQTEETDETVEADETVEPEWQRRRRLAAVFGDILPDTTGDERGRDDDGTSEDWLRRQVPPHHG